MKTNLTISLDESLVREAKVLAAQRGTSISKLLADRLEDLVRADRAYEKARRRAVARIRASRDIGWSPPSSRDELHER